MIIQHVERAEYAVETEYEVGEHDRSYDKTPESISGSEL